ncbi:MAG TPA: glycosyltransferase family 4 protein [Kofleriaceae bacterium]|jgi:glycosyltransferase involved in cell wall biosynthesis
MLYDALVVKVAHVVTNYSPSVGGAQLLFQKLSEGLVHHHHDDVTVLTTNALLSPSALDGELIAPGDEMLNGVLVRRFSYWRKPVPVLRDAMRVANRFKLPFREYLEPLRIGPISPSMFAATRRLDVDVIACMAFPFLHMYYRFGHGRTPIVLFGALHINDRKLAAPILRAVEQADAYVAFTEFERDTLVANGMDASKIHVVGLGVEVASFAGANGQAIRERLEIGDAPIVGFIGRQARYKGCDTLLNAMVQVWDRRPDAVLLLAGARTPFSDELDKMVAALPAPRRARVIMVSDFAESEKPDWFAACDVFASISTDESFGLVFLEAWAAGTPVIGGNIGAVACVIRDGEDGFLVPCGQPAPLAVAIEKLLGDDELRARMAARGNAKVRAEYDWRVVIDKVRAIYERLL